MTPNFVKDRRDAILWAKSLFQHPDSYVILDTETTGLENDAVIVQIGIIDLNGNELVNSLVKPSKKTSIPMGATNIHGITMRMVQDAPNFMDLIPQIEKVVNRKIVLIYNSEYDTRIINQTCRQDGCASIKITCDCAMKQYSKYVGEWNDYHGNYKFQKLPSGDHSAVGDCQATLKLLKKLASES
jgi:DNA polymerase III subunit epsilon